MDKNNEKNERLEVNKIDYIFGGLSAIGAMKLTRALVRASIETRNPIVGASLLAFECLIGVGTLAKGTLMSRSTRELIKGLKETFKEIAEKAEEEVDSNGGD